MSLTSLTALELGKKIRAGQVSAEEAVKDALLQIQKKEPDIHSFVTIDEEGALRTAREIQQKTSDGSCTGPLAGVPVAIKDNLCTKGLLTTCSSKMLSGFCADVYGGGGRKVKTGRRRYFGQDKYG